MAKTTTDNREERGEKGEEERQAAVEINEKL